MGKIIRFIFLFLIIMIIHEIKQKTAHASYNKNEHAAVMKKHIKYINDPFFKYLVKVSREIKLKKTPTVMRDDAEIQYEPSAPIGKNRKNTAKKGERAIPFSLAALYRSTHEEKWKADDKIIKSRGLSHSEPHKNMSRTALSGLDFIVPISKRT